MSKQLKDVLEPPFIHNGDLIEDSKSWLLTIYSHFDCADGFLDFVTAALNEKWERDFSEPVCWEMIDVWEAGYKYRCKKCGEARTFEMGNPAENGFNYCPHCGLKLDPPEPEK